MGITIVQSLLLLSGLSSFTYATRHRSPHTSFLESDVPIDHNITNSPRDSEKSSGSTKRTVYDPKSRIEWENLSTTKWSANPVCPEKSFYDSFKYEGGLFPPNMKTLDGTASYLENHKKAIQITGSPAPDLWKCKTVSCDDGAGIDWCHHHHYLIQVDTGKPLAQAAQAAIKRCKKVEDTTFDWNGVHDLGLMWGQVYSEDGEMAVQVQHLPGYGCKMHEEYLFKKNAKGKWIRQ